MSVASPLRSFVKIVVQGLSLVLAFPAALLAGFGHVPAAFQFFAQLVALVPGIPGDYLRVGYYVLTLKKCSLNSRISMGSFFAQSGCAVGSGVYIGAYCVIGMCRIGNHTQIASHVQILSGRYQHERGPGGKILGAREEQFSPVFIGEDCWVGAGAILMADVGARTTIGAGAVVTRPIPDGVTAVGSPARVLESSVR